MKDRKLLMNHLISNFKMEYLLTSENAILIFLINSPAILTMPVVAKNWLNHSASPAILFDLTFPIMRKCYHHQQQNNIYQVRTAIGRKSKIKKKQGENGVPVFPLSDLAHLSLIWSLANWELAKATHQMFNCTTRLHRKGHVKPY